MKASIKAFWEAQPCGAKYATAPEGSMHFYEQVAQERYRRQPWMAEMFWSRYLYNQQVLEIGCGLGTDALEWAKTKAVVTAVDLTTTAITQTIKRFATYPFWDVTAKVADAEMLYFASNTFDIVYSWGVLHHTPDTQKAISEACRVLKPGGTLYLMLYHRRSIDYIIGTILRPYRTAWETYGEAWIRKTDGHSPVGKCYTKRQVMRMLRGMEGVRFRLVDPVRPKWPNWLNWINQKFLMRFLGSYLVAEAKK